MLSWTKNRGLNLSPKILHRKTGNINICLPRGISETKQLGRKKFNLISFYPFYYYFIYAYWLFWKIYLQL
jgi:hypothetical protein